MVIAVIGSGGKTTCIERVAERMRSEGKRVAVMTTTHMWIPGGCCVLGGGWEEAVRMMDKEGMVYFGVEEDGQGKMVFPGDEGYRALGERADVVLVEADGSKGKPMKFPDWSREPVIPEDTDRIFLVFGLSALGRELGAVCHRWELGGELLYRGEWREMGKRIVDKEMALFFLKRGYLEELQCRFPGIPVVVIFNQADDEGRREAGEWMSAALSAWWKERQGGTEMECRVVQLCWGING